MLNRRPSPPRRSHAKSWFSWSMIGLLVIYMMFAWLLEKISLTQWLSSGFTEGSTLTSFIMGFFDLLIHWLRHLIPVAVGWWFAYNAAVETVERLYDIEAKDQARWFLGRLRSPNIRTRKSLGLNDQTLAADREHSILLRVGGPGKVKVAPRDVAITEDNGRFARILAPGSHLLLPFEYIYAVLDLRDQERTETNVSVRTKDNIDVQASFTITFRIRRGDDPPTKGRPFPFDTEAVKQAAYAQTVFDNSTVGSWESKPVSTTRSKLAEVVSQFRLDEIVHPAGRTDEPYRALRQEVFRRARTDLARYGIELLTVHIDQFKLPEEVEAQYIKYWQSHWQSKARLVEADGKATAVEELEIARAEAEIAMIQAILEGIQRARRSGATSTTSEIVALRLVEGLERMAEQSKTKHETNQSTEIVSVINNLRAELQASTTLLRDQYSEGSDAT